MQPEKAYYQTVGGRNDIIPSPNQFSDPEAHDKHGVCQHHRVLFILEACIRESWVPTSGA